MADATKRKLKLPSWHVPYLEKYRIMELFRELTKELVINQPIDHVLFLKEILKNAAESRNVARLILLGSPKVNSLEVAKQISNETNQFIVYDDIILQMLAVTNRRDVTSEMLTYAIKKLIRTEKVCQSGWIIADCIRSAEEAKSIIEAGIIPTHVIHLIPQFAPPLNELLYCDVHQGWPAYRRSIMVIRDVFKSKLIELHLGQRTFYDVVNMCIQIMLVREDARPIKLRVLIIGPRGSGRKTQAKLLAKDMNLVYIDFEALFCQAWRSESKLGERVRSFKDEACFRSDLMVEIINERILQDDCMQRGWVLTGFPYNVQDFKFFDTVDTPPNRVIILELDLNICRDRILNRRVNAHTGSITNIIEEPESLIYKRLNVHPKDRKETLEAELTYYCEQYGTIRSYCGNTATVVNGNQSKRCVYECVCAILSRGSPTCPPRQPCPPTDEKETSSRKSTDNNSNSSNKASSTSTIPGGQECP